MLQHSRSGALFIFLSVIGYSLLPIWVKNIQSSGMQPIDIATWRFLFAAPIFWLIIYARRMPRPDKPLPRLRLMGMGMLLSTAALLTFFGLRIMPASTFVVLFYSYPAMVAMLSALLGERLSRQGWLALGLTLVGVVFTAPNFSSALLTGGNLPGVALALLNALVVAIYFIISSRLLRGHAAIAHASAWTITGALVGLLALAPFGTVEPATTATTWLFLLLLAMTSTVFPVFFLNAGIQKAGAARAAILGMVEPVLTVILATLLLGERMQPIQLVGGAFILGSIVLLQAQHLSRPRWLAGKIRSIST
jgi:drug/metabolite transporter (DMT)-like permease